MRALVKAGPAPRFELRDVADPEPGRDEVAVRVAAVGVCGTDVHILHDVYAHADPLIPGHEFVGEIVSVGVDVSAWSVGERVVSELHTGACRICDLCRSGNPQICLQKRALGTWTDGAYAEVVRVPAWLLHRPPEILDDAQATLIEPAACAVHGVLERGRIDPGDRVLVTGHGPIGLLAAQVAAASGAEMVVVSGTSRRGTTRLRAAEGLGFDVIDALTEDVGARARELTGGTGFDLVIETAGTEGAIAQAISATARGGRVTVLSLAGGAPVAFPWDAALLQDLDFSFSFSSKASSWRTTIDLMAAGRLGGHGLITHDLGLEAWADGYAAIERGEAVKVVLRP